LKLEYKALAIETGNMVDDRDSLQQGLKPECDFSAGALAEVDDRDPLQQGLKRSGGPARVSRLSDVDDRDPLQQGLKLDEVASNDH